MKLTKKEFIKNVKNEIRAIKKYASKKEISRLIFKRFNPTNRYECVYGQMAEGCRSERAIKLIQKCCKKFAPSECWTKIRSMGKNSNNCNFSSKISNHHLLNMLYYSILESFIVDEHYRQFNKQVLQFIKGKINTLSFIKATK